MNTEKPYIIEYPYTFKFNERVLGFRKKELFDITDDIPKHIKFVETHWNINRKQLSKTKAQELVKKETVIKDVSSLQWYQQEQLKHVFNLWK